MKTSLRIVPIICIALLLQGGCATTDVQKYVTPANARIATALVCSNTLNFAVKDEDRTEVANYIYSVAHGIRTLAGGAVPSPDELRQTVSLFTPGAGKWVSLGQSIAAIYGGLYPQIQGNPKLALQYLEAIAAGCEDAALPYYTPKPSPTP